jgi:hypothetical protein
MVDPTWLPSTIMQTIGALYGIFIAIFVLVIQNLFQYKKQTKDKQDEFNQVFDIKVNSFKTLFCILAYFVVLVELYNGMLVYLISDSILEKFNYCLLFSYFSFICLLIYIIVFSYYLVTFLISLEMDKPDFNEVNFYNRAWENKFYYKIWKNKFYNRVQNEFYDKVRQITFFDGIVILAFLFVSVTASVISGPKYNLSPNLSIIFGLISLGILFFIYYKF